MPPAPRVLVIAGLDPSGGAGLLADVRTLAELGVGALGVATALTEQGHAGVRSVNAVDPALVARQVRAALADEPVDAVKIGMLGRAATARAVAAALAAWETGGLRPAGSSAGGPGNPPGAPGSGSGAIPVVLDPVWRATSGAPLVEDDDSGTALCALRALLPHATLVTPNAVEAALLCGEPAPGTLAAAAALAAALRARGARAVLLKGGHLPEAATPGEVVDLLDDGSGAPLLLRAPRGRGAHGTGCALASAVAAGLAARRPLAEAVRAAHAFVAQRLAAAVDRAGTRYLY